jgi:hypothetical protein
MGNIIIVVAPDRLELLPELNREFGGDGVHVVVDRRQDNRRQRFEKRSEPERRLHGRRGHQIQSDLDRLGFAVAASQQS